MPQKGRVAPASNSGLAGKITKITAIVVALTGLLTAIVHFRDSIPWLTPVATINVTPSPVNLDLGDKFQILATVKDSKENPLGKKVTWSSANPSVAAVANDGIVTASGVGETTIMASIGPVRGATLVHVRRVTVASVEVFPPTTTLQVADHVRFDGTPYDADGNALPGRLVRWASENNSVASVDQTSGDVTGRSVGHIKVTAESEGKFNAAPVTVIPKPRHEGASEAHDQPSVPDREASNAKPPQPSPDLPTPQTPAPVIAQKIAIRGGGKTGDCPAAVRILLGNSLVVLKSDPQEVFGVPSGNLSYSLHGTVSCPRQSIAVVDGHGTLTVGNQENYRCRWQRVGPRNYLISLESE
jgi:Bacterial Ig-like domain (group 2)